MNDSKMYAFPTCSERHLQEGLTKREYFAAMAMQSIIQKEVWIERVLSEKSGENSHVNKMVKASLILADALLSELDKTK